MKKKTLFLGFYCFYAVKKKLLQLHNILVIQAVTDYKVLQTIKIIDFYYSKDYWSNQQCIYNNNLIELMLL